VREISSYAVGMVVQKDELLATYFTRDFQTPQNAYIFALNNRDHAESTPDQTRAVENNVRLAEEGLINLGMSPTQIREIARTRLAASIVQVRAPETGIILLRNVSHNLRIDRNVELYRLADMRTVYVYAEAPELEAEYIPLGASAEVRYQGRVLKARIAKALPLFDAETKRLKLRLELDNPGYVLRPGMFVDVQLAVHLPPGVAVPLEALVDSGARKVVYIASDNGHFEARQVQTGWRLADRVQIVSGLRAGERIVVSGNFLIDSEARMKAATAPAPSSARVHDPVCGMEMERKASAGSFEYGGVTYYFCSRECEEKFEKTPQQYALSQPRRMASAALATPAPASPTPPGPPNGR
jgi:YHS domain-containing protein/multidrug efflux pump subunit AcrA (membrane-fusion protein)